MSLGGNCTMTDAIPSKTLLTTADAMLEVARAEEVGLDFSHGLPSVNLRRTLARSRAVALHQSRGVRERMDGVNVRVLPGRGHVTGPNELVANVDGRDHTIEFDALLVCTGASPFVPLFANPDGNRVLTTRQVFDLRDLPEHLVVLGAGPTGWRPPCPPRSLCRLLHRMNPTCRFRARNQSSRSRLSRCRNVSMSRVDAVPAAGGCRQACGC